MINPFFSGKTYLLALLLSASGMYAQNIQTPKALVPPKALRPDIKVEHVMSVAAKSVRILYDKSTGNVFFTCYDGEVYQIKNIQDKNPVAVKILSVEDHSIPRLQGAAIYNNTLFLTGNTKVNNGLGNKGRMVRYDLKQNEKPVMSVVFNTVEYGTNRTVFDHGWNALEISPDGKYIFVNSGARTDHGEVQDNNGAWPNARNGALTSRIFRFPFNSKDLILPDDEAKLKAEGYIYAEGIRNAYDLAFDGSGNLFGVSNSSDYDHNEDMFWIRQGHHYGFPWVIGGIENPQQYPDWQPNPDTDPFIPRSAHAWAVRYFRNDPDFPKIPEGVKFSPGVQNLGPDANEYRGHSGKVLDGDLTGVSVSTFTPHSSPLALFFDREKNLSRDFRGDGFTIRYSLGARSALMKPFTDQGADLLHLDLSYDKATDNYFVKTSRIVEGFNAATDAVMIKNNVFVIEYGAAGGNIWKISLPK
ncbi:Glucose / Sorbosone dehydrogenase [Daejeonella rubra]|uniref:Glucose / Sorbosone dehydrogenase n=1 Tax=Daejeonella rubra TaxID=990371 RepID=A0A1G9TTB5_9SPHI|nr:PQQ-dependent sugar dehydrogenase [Daejeonella rubra]SDM50936.1 Glucose / Sorbosone dehydrogenase [Daejeonella rubra]